MQSQTRSESRIRFSWFVLASLIPLGAISRAQLEVVRGFRAAATPLPKPAKGWSAFDLLPDGSIAAFDGQKLVVLDPATGRLRKTLATLSTTDFGADVRVGPTGRRLFFGHPSTGAMFVHDLADGATRQFGTLKFHYAFAFHPAEGERFVWVSARPGSTAQILRVDSLSGKSDLIAETEGFSGPLVFGREGELYFAPSTGTPKNILSWTKAQVIGAIGAGHLTTRDARVFASGFHGAYQMVIDGEGTFYVTDSFPTETSSLMEIGPAGGTRSARNVVRLRGEAVTTLRFVAGGRPFERFGSSGSSLWLLSSDFGAGNHLIRVDPARPRLDVRGTSTLVYQGAGLPRQAFALWLLGAGLRPERPLLPLGAGGLSFPELGIVPTAPFLAVTTTIDGQGTTQLSLARPNERGLQWTTQILAGPVQALPGGTPASLWVTSNPVTVANR